MSNETSARHAALEDVLQDYALAEPGPSYDVLTDWIRRYPQFERELTEFTASWIVMQHVLPPAEPSGAESVDEEDRLVLRGMSILENVLHSVRTAEVPFQRQQSEVEPSPSEPPLTGLVEEGKRLHLSLDQLAEHCGMGKALVRKLDRCLIQPSSIPSLAVERLARTLRKSAPRVAEYLAGASRFASLAQYKSEHAPTLAEPENFFDAVRHDRTMTDAQRMYWLSLEPTRDRDG